MSIPLNRSNLYLYLMNIIEELDSLMEKLDRGDPEMKSKDGARELARQIIVDFELAPKVPETH